ncbi:RNA-binding protein S4 [Agaricicola taiwanensis]|uniref:RNA-binding protein S4 n=1 Tax=Agaricicola taiwanensis TaxID=591372 RepID=A0A8J2YKV5_9RHOB|nr:RNA-binding S4 domain-containing protein [Agaricicola taiwanensis]GGE51895.1 RNA-binding protein S4 [Agaricicola taiwanensis]
MSGPSAEAEGAGRQRIDKWLWHARVVKTRTLAQNLVRSGHVRLNTERILDAAHWVRAGDVLTIALSERLLVYVVRQFAQRRGGASEARVLYEDQSPPPAPRTPPPAPRDPGSGRPTKKERRETDGLKETD